MNKMITLAAVLGASLLFGQAQAAPIGNVSPAGESAGSIASQVDYRGYRHCHGRYNRYCHGARGYRGPGINLYIGPRYGHRGWRGHRGHRGYGHRGFAR